MKRYCIFSVVASAGSMTAASKKLGMSPSAISQNISQLESALGVTLLHRSTRGLSVSEAGQILLQGYSQMRSHFESLEQKLSDCREGVKGDVRITCCTGLAQTAIAHALAPCLSTYPDIRLNLIADDKMRDIVQENIDIAITLGETKDCNLVYRPLGSIPRVLCASEQYLSTFGIPQVASDLINHQWVVNSDSDAIEVVCRNAEIEEKRRLKIRCRVNNEMTARSFALSGQGLVLLPLPLAEEYLRRGELTCVLNHIAWSDIKVQALTICRTVPKKVDVMLEALKTFFKPELKKAKALH
ncbi:LysR family transcriptional regulator [Vibrio sp. S9_S30]|uniref:LysR family transcriptional regulator n=1 Tax=Vibrio sp. S9_S30 TaxID=2720226 RepID=UPI001681AB49|nr:LysR substrate-binding domain-containing protein [Vibrio sp. S9_S30]MBD1556292.1 LysR family transcriptional regulator [Vibrio sp. S9_S30]